MRHLCRYAGNLLTYITCLGYMQFDKLCSIIIHVFLNQKWHWFMIMKYVGNYFILIPSNFIDSYQVELNSTTSLMPPEIPEKTNEVISRKVNSLNDWALVGQFSNSLLTSPKLKDKVILNHPLLSDVILCNLLSVLACGI